MRKKTNSVPSSSVSIKRGRVGLFNLVLLVSGVISVLAVSSISWALVTGDSGSAKIYSIRVVNEFPHDDQAFTQGLLFAGNGTLYESTGLYDKSSVRRVNLQTGTVELLKMMSASYFGEGLTLVGERLYQVTWLTKTAFIYDRKTLNQLQTITHNMQDGWGLATNGKVLFGSDGTSTLYQLDIRSLKITRKHNIVYGGQPVRYLNELEFVNGEVWANVWQTDCIARISPTNGAVVGWIFLPQLRLNLTAAGHNGIDVLNGIAWDSAKNRIFVTGKLWPKIYEVKLTPASRDIDAGTIQRYCIPR